MLFFCFFTNVRFSPLRGQFGKIRFENNEFTKPAALIKFIQKNADVLSLRSDHRIILKSNWQNETSRLEGVKRFLIKLVNI